MAPHVRLATWNLDRPMMRHRRRATDVAQQLRDVAADIWILVETDESIDLSETHHAYSTPSITGYHEISEHWVTVWSKWPGRQVKTADSRVSVCVDIPSPAGDLLVYGTVLPYHADRGPDGTARNWVQHYRALDQQGADWQRLRGGSQRRLVCVAGDLNQSRDGRGWPIRQWYGTEKGRDQLSARLLGASLECATNADFFATGELIQRSTVMHVCVPQELSKRIVGRFAWFKTDSAGRAVSDHNGIHIDIAV